MLKMSLDFVRESSPRVDHDGLHRADPCDRGLVLQQSGSSLKADVFVARFNGRCVVVKDYSASPVLLRATLCRWLVHREMAAMKRLVEHPGIPRLIGDYGRYGFAMEQVVGQTLENQALKERPELLRQLDAHIRLMHRLGVTHNDIRKRNLLVNREGDLVMIDFASAVIRTDHALSLSTLLFLITRLSDRIKLVKLKQQWNPGTLNQRDRKLARFVVISSSVSRLWKRYIYRFLKALGRMLRATKPAEREQ